MNIKIPNYWFPDNCSFFSLVAVFPSLSTVSTMVVEDLDRDICGQRRYLDHRDISDRVFHVIDACELLGRHRGNCVRIRDKRSPSLLPNDICVVNLPKKNGNKGMNRMEWNTETILIIINFHFNCFSCVVVVILNSMWRGMAIKHVMR